MPTRMVTSLDQPFLPRSSVACKSMCLATIKKLLMKRDRFAAFNPDKAVAGSANQKPRFIDSEGPVFRLWWARIDIDEFL